VIENRPPEPDGDEGLRDVRVIAAVEESLRTGAVVKLPPMPSRHWPAKLEPMTLGAVKEPELVNVAAPEKG
jgi:hypothetical protein